MHEALHALRRDVVALHRAVHERHRSRRRLVAVVRRSEDDLGTGRHRVRRRRGPHRATDQTRDHEPVGRSRDARVVVLRLDGDRTLAPVDLQVGHLEDRARGARREIPADVELLSGLHRASALRDEEALLGLRGSRVARRRADRELGTPTREAYDVRDAVAARGAAGVRRGVVVGFANPHRRLVLADRVELPADVDDEVVAVRGRRDDRSRASRCELQPVLSRGHQDVLGRRIRAEGEAHGPH